MNIFAQLSREITADACGALICSTHLKPSDERMSQNSPGLYIHNISSHQMLGSQLVRQYDTPEPQSSCLDSPVVWFRNFTIPLKLTHNKHR